MFHRHEWLIIHSEVIAKVHDAIALPHRRETHISLQCVKCQEPRLQVFDGVWRPGEAEL